MVPTIKTKLIKDKNGVRTRIRINKAVGGFLRAEIIRRCKFIKSSLQYDYFEIQGDYVNFTVKFSDGVGIMKPLLEEEK